MSDQPEPTPKSVDEEDPGWPVGFLLFVGLGALYLVVRFVQVGARFIEWLR